MPDSLNGILFVDKESGCTTFDIIRQVKKQIKGKIKAGHTGTLDPIATGLVIILLGKATKISDLFHCFPKTYRAVFQFGLETDTHDVQGEIKKRYSGRICLSADDLKEMLKGFEGVYQTRPPEYSAKKIKGKPAYYYARKNIKVALEETRNMIYRSQVLKVSGFIAELEFEVSKGTYIRSIARDIGDISGYGCIMKELRRISIGDFNVTGACNQANIKEGAFMDHIRHVSEVLYPCCTSHADLKEGRPGSAERIVLPDNLSSAGSGLPCYGRDSEFFIIGDKERDVLMIVQKERDDRMKILYRNEERFGAV